MVNTASALGLVGGEGYEFTEAFRIMCPNIDIIRLEEPEDIFPAYTKAWEREDGRSTLLVEYGDYYGEK